MWRDAKYAKMRSDMRKARYIQRIFSALCLWAATTEAGGQETQAAGQLFADALRVGESLQRIFDDGSERSQHAAMHGTDFGMVDSVESEIRRLRSLPPEQLKELCLQVDAYMCSLGGMRSAFLAEMGHAVRAGKWGLELLAEAAQRQNLTEEQVELLHRLGENAVRTLPARLLTERLPADDKAALRFFKEFCKAVSARTDAEFFRLLPPLPSEIPHLDLLSRKWFAMLDTQQNEPAYPYPLPMLPDELQSKERMQALRPYFQAAPILQHLVRDDSLPKFITFFDFGGFCEGDDSLDLSQASDGRSVCWNYHDSSFSTAELCDYLKSCGNLPEARIVLHDARPWNAPEVQVVLALLDSLGAAEVKVYADADGNVNAEMLRRVAHPDGRGWVEFRPVQLPYDGRWSEWGFNPVIPVRTPGGRLLEYLSENAAPGVLRLAEPWSPDGRFLLLPVSLQKGFILVPVEALESPRFDWSHAKRICAPVPEGVHVFVAWQPDSSGFCFRHVADGEIVEYVYDVNRESLKRE